MPAMSLPISHREMQMEREHGRVRRLHRDISGLRKWHGTWRLLSANGWFRVTGFRLAGRPGRAGG
jgi:hypothetical protein